MVTFIGTIVILPVQIHKQVVTLEEDIAREHLVFKAMNQKQRSVVHEVVEDLGMVCYAFGMDGVDRACVAFKQASDPPLPFLHLTPHFQHIKWSAPSTEDLFLMDRQLVYAECLEQLKVRKKERAAAALSAIASESHRAKLEDTRIQQRRKRKVIRQHLEAEKANAAEVETQSTYGMVDPALKRDRRTMEEAMHDIRARKIQRMGGKEGHGGGVTSQ